MCKIYNNAQKQLKTKQRAKFRLDMFDHLLDTVISTMTPPRFSPLRGHH